MSIKLYVGNLSFSSTEKDLQDLFGGVGNVEHCEVIVDRFTKRSRGFAFVEMATKEDANKAIETLHGKEFQGRTLMVNEARPKTERPPRYDSGPRRNSYRE